MGTFGQIVFVGGLWNHQLTVKKVGLGRWLGFGLGYTEKVAIPDSFSGIQSEAIWHQWTISWFPVFKVGIIYGFSQRKLPPVARTPSRKYGLMIRAYFINHWFPLIRPAIKPLFLGGVGYKGGLVEKSHFHHFSWHFFQVDHGLFRLLLGRTPQSHSCLSGDLHHGRPFFARRIVTGDGWWFQGCFTTFLEHTPGNSPTQSWKESLFSLLVMV